MSRIIRNAETSDLERIIEIYAIARNFMRSHDNPDQWNNNHPSRKIVEDDINRRKNYVIEENGTVEAVFYFAVEKDPTYDYIDGAWLKPDAVYGVIHRIASSGNIKGVLKSAVDFGATRIKALRIDTHKDNYVMRNAILKNGFIECGIIYLSNGEPRIAYERA